MGDDATVWIWTTAILAVSVGFAVGFLVAYLAVLRDKDAAGLREQLAQQKEEFDTYRGRVDEHFVKTSELFQDMTRHYGALHQHLAHGAQSLCSDRLVTHEPIVPESTPMVEHKGAPQAQPPAPPAAAPETATETARESAPESASEPAAEPEVPATSAPREPVHSASSNGMDESEMESFAPRPEAEHLRTPAPTAAKQQSERSESSQESKPQLH